MFKEATDLDMEQKRKKELAHLSLMYIALDAP